MTEIPFTLIVLGFFILILAVLVAAAGVVLMFASKDSDIKAEDFNFKEEGYL